MILPTKKEPEGFLVSGVCFGVHDKIKNEPSRRQYCTSCGVRLRFRGQEKSPIPGITLIKCKLMNWAVGLLDGKIFTHLYWFNHVGKTSTALVSYHVVSGNTLF